MRRVEILKVDGKGRITIPRNVREVLGIEGGSHVVMVADLDKGEIIILPGATKEGTVVELSLVFKDKPGSLAKIAEKMSQLGINQLSTNCKTIKKGEKAECMIIAEIKGDPKKIEEELKKMDEVIDVFVYTLPKP